jgi:hypothetical protein
MDEAARKVGNHLRETGVDITEDMQVIAFAVPEQLDRQKAKIALIQILHAGQKLSASYFGSAPGIPAIEDDMYLEWGRQMMKIIDTD